MGVGFEVEKADVDLAAECREEIDLLQASMPDASIRFIADGPVRGKFDSGRVREALANLVVNAAKYGTRGGEIQVELSDDADGAELVVRNPGDPIPRETFDMMFEPLRRGGVARGEPERASLGLGLFIVSQIANAHGGAIHAHRRAGRRRSS